MSATNIDMLYTPSTDSELTTVGVGGFVAAVVLMAPGSFAASLSRAIYFIFSITVLGLIRASVSM